MKTGATRNQVVLAWLLRQGIRPIVGVSDLVQLDEAVAFGVSADYPH
ncbi:hypothetical protein [Micromonospora rifamycinica]|nr:hypothetical protein [Micromonospora rifamycinica]